MMAGACAPWSAATCRRFASGRHIAPEGKRGHVRALQGLAGGKEASATDLAKEVAAEIVAGLHGAVGAGSVELCEVKGGNQALRL